MLDKIQICEQVEPDLINWSFTENNSRTSGQFIRGQQEFDDCQQLAVFVPLNMDEYNAKLEAAKKQEDLDNFRNQRENEVSALKVTISTGKTFDADEPSISRMTGRVVSYIGAPDDFVVKWSTADVPTGFMIDVTLGELKEALRMATDQVTDSWSV